MPKKRIDPEVRFKRLCTAVQSGCWEWNTKSPSRKYGAFLLGDRQRRPIPAHRAAWIIFVGDIPEGMHVLHKCDNTWCVNPSHLFLGTHADNMRDMKQKGRGRTASGDQHWTRLQPNRIPRGPSHKWYERDVRGEKNPRAKLTTEDVRCIKRLIQQGLSDQEISSRFSVKSGNIWHIRTGRNWTHV